MWWQLQEFGLGESTHNETICVKYNKDDKNVIIFNKLNIKTKIKSTNKFHVIIKQ